MYFAYVCYKGKLWSVEQPCCVMVSQYNDYEQGDHAFPCGTEDFGGLTVIAPIDFKSLAAAYVRGFRDIYSNLPDYRITGLITEALEDY